jgi:hypothetical protein
LRRRPASILSQPLSPPLRFLEPELRWETHRFGNGLQLVKAGLFYPPVEEVREVRGVNESPSRLLHLGTGPPSAVWVRVHLQQSLEHLGVSQALPFTSDCIVLVTKRNSSRLVASGRWIAVSRSTKPIICHLPISITWRTIRTVLGPVGTWSSALPRACGAVLETQSCPRGSL